MKGGHCMWLSRTEGLLCPKGVCPQRQDWPMGDSASLKHLNTTTLWPSEPVSHSPPDSGSSEAMVPLRRAAAAPPHFLGFTKCNFVLQKGFRVGRLPGHTVSSKIHPCCYEAQGHQLTCTKSKGNLRKSIRLCWNWESCKFIPETAFSIEANKSFALPSPHLPTGLLIGKKRLLITWLQSFVAPWETTLNYFQIYERKLM